MFTLHQVRGSRGKATSIGLLNPHPATGSLEVFDFGLGKLANVDAADVLVVATGESCSPFPKLRVETVSGKLLDYAANRKVVPFARKFQLDKKRSAPDTNFVTGYEELARPWALYWRNVVPSTQTILAAGIFALSTIHTSIDKALALFVELGPYLLEDSVPGADELQRIVRRSGAGLHMTRTSAYLEFYDYRVEIRDVLRFAKDNEARHILATEKMPVGLGVAKLSFILSLLGNNVACLDARIINWAFTERAGEQFVDAISRKNARGAVSDAVVATYEDAESAILKATPFYDPKDPVALARAQWLLWESLGPDGERTHTHRELFYAVAEAHDHDSA